MATVNERLNNHIFGLTFKKQLNNLPKSLSGYQSLQCDSASVLCYYQVLRPGTRRKLRILGEDYQKVLSEHLQALPSFLGGDCTCPKCSKFIGGEETNVVVPSVEYEDKNVPSSHSTYRADDFESVKCDKVLKSITIGLILLLLFIVFGVHFHSLEGIQLYRRGG